jgi:hypothetical protein
MNELTSGEPGSSETQDGDTPSDTAEKPTTSWLRSPNAYGLLVIVALMGLVFLWVGIYHAMGRGFHPQDVSRIKILRTTFAFVLAAPFLGVAGTFFYLNLADSRNRRREALAQLHSSMLSTRAIQASIALQEATQLVEELRAELEARTTLLDDVKRQVADASQRAQEIEKLTQVDEETTQILNRYFDEALSKRLSNLEQGSRRREWLLGTFGALASGVIAILVAHYMFGFLWGDDSAPALAFASSIHDCGISASPSALQRSTMACSKRSS